MSGNRGFTLVETMVAVLLGSLLLMAVTKIFSGGVRMTQKGSSHLTLAQGAGMLMAQIEKDLTSAVTLPEAGLAWKMAGNVGEKGRIATMAVQYELLPDKPGGVRRKAAPESSGSPAAGSPAAGTPVIHTFCSGLATSLELKSADVGSRKARGYVVTIKVQGNSGVAGGESLELRRFIFCYNLPANHQMLNGYWRWD